MAHCRTCFYYKWRAFWLTPPNGLCGWTLKDAKPGTAACAGHVYDQCWRATMVLHHNKRKEDRTVPFVRRGYNAARRRPAKANTWR
jgi:hypothetical protein